MSSTDDRKSEVLFQVSFTVLKQDSLFAPSLLLQPFIPETNLSKKAIRCHYHRQKSLDNGKELLSSEEDSKESDTVSDNEENS